MVEKGGSKKGSVREEREAYGPSKFSIPRTSRDDWWTFECQSTG